MHKQRHRYWLALAIALTGPISLLACLDEDVAPTATAPSNSTTYRGVLSGAHETGVLDVKMSDGSTSATKALANGSSLAVTATLQLQGQTLNLTGTFDPTTGAFSLSGGGYTLTGKAASSGISGTYTGPNGSGMFVLLPSSPAAQPSVFCGSFDGDDTGVWNVTAVSGGTAVGAWANRSGSTGSFVGNWAASGALTLQGDPVSATGTLQSSGSGNGTWSSTKGEKGKWTTGQCQLGGPAPGDAGAGTDATTTQEAGADATVDRDGGVVDEGGVTTDGGTGNDGAVDTDATSGSDSGSGGNDGSAAGDGAIDLDAGVGMDGSVGVDAGIGTDGSVGLDGGVPIDDASVGMDGSVGVDAGGGMDGSVGFDAGSSTDGGATLDASVDAAPSVDWQEIYSASNMCTLATDSTYVYVGFCKGGGIVRIPVTAGDAGAPTTVVTSAYPLAMTVSGSTIYWLDNGGHLESAPVGSTSASGTQLAPSSIDTGTGSLNVDNGSVYWVNGGIVSQPVVAFVGAIQKVPTTGGTPVSLVSNVTNLGSMAVASDGYAYYSVGSELRRISTSATDAGASELVKSATVRNVQFADNGFLFWSEADTYYRMYPGQSGQAGQALPGLTSFVSASDFLYYRNTGGQLFKGNSFGTVTLTPVSSDTGVGPYVVASGYVYWISNASKLRRANW